MFQNLKKIFFSFLILSVGLSLLFVTACNGDAETEVPQVSAKITSVSITASAQTMAASASVTLTAVPVITGEPSVTYTWQITSGSEYAVLASTSGKIVTLNGKNTTYENQSVTVTVTADGGRDAGVKTAAITITVNAKVQEAALNSVTVSGTSAIEAAGKGNLTATPSYTGDIAQAITYTWTITSGSEYASVSGNGKDAEITGKNTDSQAHNVTVQVSATYNGLTKTASKTVTVAGASVVVENELTALSLASSAASLAPDGRVTITPTATYTGSLSESDFTVSGWAITSGASYASLLIPGSGNSRSSLTFTGDNTSYLQANNTTTSEQTVSVSVKVSYGGVEKTASCTVTVLPAKVTSVSVSGTTSIECDGSTELTANVSKDGNPANVTYSWEITEGASYAEITSGQNAESVTINGSNAEGSAKSVTLTVTVSDGTNTLTKSQLITVGANASANAEESGNFFPEKGESAAYADTYFELAFDSAPSVNRASSGTVRIYKADGSLVDTIKPAGETMYGYGYGGNSVLGSINVQYQLIQVIGNKVRIIPHHNTSTGYTLLENSSSYYVLIDNGLITGTIEGTAFAGISDSSEWTFTTGAAPTVSGNTITVGEGKNFITVQGAFSYLMKNNKSGDWTVKIESGTYYERLFYKGNASITLSGQGSAEYGTDVEIQWCNQDGDAETTLWNTGTRGRNVFYFAGKNLVLENLSIYNIATRYTNEYGEYDSSAQTDTAKGKNQAEALMFDSTGNLAAYNCNFKSKQDTLYLSPSGGKAWFYGCKISGDIDFIWGLSDVALFERCNIISAYDARATNTYILAPHLSNSSAPYGKGFVLYNSTVTTESGQTTYLARSPWGSSGTVSQVAVIDTSVTGGLASNPWYGSHVGGDDETVLGWKWYGVTSDGSAISAANKLSQSQYEAEFAGRNNIINRTYDGSKFTKAATIWDVNTLAQSRSWNVVTDTSKATLDGESEITTVVYDFGEANPSSFDDLTCTSIGWNNSAYASGGNGAAISFDVTNACAVTVYYCYAASGTITAGSQEAVNFSTNSGSTSQIETTEYEVTAAGTVTVAYTGTSYLTKITITYTSSGSGEGGEEEASWTWTAIDYADGVTTDKTPVSDGTAMGKVSASGTGLNWRVSGGSAYCIETGKAANGCLTFTTTETATITIIAASTGNSNTSDAILSTSASTTGAISEASGATTVTGSNPQTTLTYNNVAAGTYYFGAFPASSNSRGIRVYSITVSSGSTAVSSVTISGKTSVLVGTSITLTATPDATPSDSTYTWNLASGSGYVSLGSSTTNTVTVTGVSAGNATITATVDGVTSSAYTVTAVATEDLVIADGDIITDSDTTSRSGTLTITKGETPTGYAGVGYSAPSYTTVTVTTAADLVNYAKKGGYFIIVDGMIDMTTRYNGSTMLPSVGGGTTTALDAFVNEKSGGDYSTYLEWQASYAASCSLTTEDGESGSGNSSLYSMLWTLNNAYKNIIQLNVAANTAIVGKDADSGIRGAAISISGVSNVVLRNLNLSDSCDPFPHHESEDGYNAQHDCICIQGNSSYIWIDHCTLEDTYTLAHVKTGGSDLEKWQTYDGLLDIKGTGANITVSYCKFKNHDKTSLIGSSDSEGSASTRLVTYHHNYFYNCGQRLPMVRNTTMHLYNNLYEYSNGDYSQQYAVGPRKGSVIYSENNYFGSGINYAFKDSGTSSSSGTVNSSGDSFNSTYGTERLSNEAGTTLFSSLADVYSYSAETAATVKTNLPSEAGNGAVTIN